jgi:hypothetical protein
MKLKKLHLSLQMLLSLGSSSSCFKDSNLSLILFFDFYWPTQESSRSPIPFQEGWGRDTIVELLLCVLLGWKGRYRWVKFLAVAEGRGLRDAEHVTVPGRTACCTQSCLVFCLVLGLPEALVLHHCTWCQKLTFFWGCDKEVYGASELLNVFSPN